MSRKRPSSDYGKVVVLVLSLILAGCASNSNHAELRQFDKDVATEEKSNRARRPDEVKVEQLFNAKRATLERLVEMSNQDFSQTKVIRIAPEFTRLETNWAWPRPENLWGISATRWNEYRKLFESAQLPFGIQRDGDGYRQVYFPLWGAGMVGDKEEKGVMFSPKTPADIRSERQRIIYESLSGNWYYYEWTTR